MLYCPGTDCPLRADCYRHTQPTPGRDRLAALPYDAATRTCDFFVCNEPSKAAIRQAAYYLWLQRGQPSGQADALWQEAERQACRIMGRK